METYQPKPLEDRESQKIGVKDAALWFGKILGIGIAGGLAARVIAGATGAKIPLPTKTREWLAENADIARFLKFYGVDGTHILPKGIGIIAGKISGIGALFMTWQKNESARIGIDDIYADLKDVSNLHWTNEDLQRDNDLTKKMIAYEQRQQEKFQSGTSPVISNAEHKGKVGEHQIAEGVSVNG
ncbi:MAG: hypothetical protein U1E36_02025 [Rickettsiales bacterium]